MVGIEQFITAECKEVGVKRESAAVDDETGCLARLAAVTDELDDGAESLDILGCDHKRMLGSLVICAHCLKNV